MVHARRQWIIPNHEISNDQRCRDKSSSLAKHIIETFGASVTFAASLAAAVFICSTIITAAIIIFLLKSLINIFTRRNHHLLLPSPSSEPTTLSPSLAKPILRRSRSQKFSSTTCLLESIIAPSPPAPGNKLLPKSSKKTLFLGLRRVLVRFTVNPPWDRFDFVAYPLIKGKTRACYVLKRPGIDELLRAAKNALFEVIIYTSALSEYAEPIIDMLDPTRELITHRLYKNACTKHGKASLVKDLVTTGRQLHRCVIIDDNPKKHVKQWANAIAVRPFFGDHIDMDLINLLKFFEVERNFNDLRHLINVMSFRPAVSVLPLPSTNKKTLFLDLDQTLIYAKTTRPNHRNYFVNEPYFIVKRPGVEELLHAASRASFEIVIFTAGSAGYASPILDWLDPDGKFIAHRLYRDACTEIKNGVYAKDLAATGRRLERSVIIDDSPQRVWPRENAISVQPFKGNLSDTQLRSLLLFFEVQSRFSDIRIAAEHVDNNFYNSFSSESFLKRDKTRIPWRRKWIDGSSNPLTQVRVT